MELTESNIKSVVGRTWFDVREEVEGEFMIDSRDNGDVGEETAGVEDIREGKRMLPLLREAFPDAKVSGQVVDEWVIITVKP
jgi:hypothetical protein